MQINEAPSITALLVDDEPLARTLLRKLLEEQGVHVKGDAGDGATALQLVRDLAPDLVFLDIEMPEMTGMEMADLVSQMESPPLIIFVTGYSEHAPAAFDREALDYLLKPVSKKRLAQTLIRARARLDDAEARAVSAAAIAKTSLTSPLRLSRLPIRDDYMVHFVRIEDIIFAEARDRRVIVHTEAAEHKTWYTLKYLEDHLPSDRFMRVHDAYIVNIELIEDLLFLGNHAYEIRLRNNQRIPVGRTRYQELQRRLGV